MKNSNLFKMSFGKIAMSLLAVALLLSCESEFNSTDPILQGDDEPPVITSVSEAREDLAVTQGTLEGTYIVRGKNLKKIISVTFNGFPGFLAPALSTDVTAFVRVSRDTPYLGQTNIMRLETLTGFVDYPFSLLTIEDYTEELIDGKNAVVINGGDFTNVNSVQFVSGTEEAGNLVELDADILSVTASQIAVEVPPGVLQAFIYVSTTGGATVQSDSYGFNYSIYADAFNGWSLGGWGDPQEESSEIALGSNSVKKQSKQWEGLTFSIADDGEDLVFSDYSTMVLSIYPESDITRLKLRINDVDIASNNNDTDYFLIEVVPGEWNKIVLNLNTFYPGGDAPEEMTRFDFQLASAVPDGDDTAVYYIDQFGFVE